MQVEINSAVGWFLVTVFGQVLYHITASLSEGNGSPLEIAIRAYAVALFIVCVVGVSAQEIDFSSVFSSTGLWMSVGLGVGIVLIEVGFLYAYRNGLPLSTGAVSTMALTAVVLMPISFFFFSQALSLKSVSGAFIALLGVWILRS